VAVYFITKLEIGIYNWFTNMVMVCAECQCAPAECAKDSQNITQCINCIKPVCCCIDFHQDLSDNTRHSDNHVTLQYRYRFSSTITFLGYSEIVDCVLGLVYCYDSYFHSPSLSLHGIPIILSKNSFL
jgi:hypothetical protein